MKLDEIFNVYAGVSANSMPKLSKVKRNEKYVAFLRPSKSMSGLLIGYVNEDLLTIKQRSKIVPAESIILATNGAGSHSYAYVYPERFLGNSDTLSLVPNGPLTLEEKIWYSMAITKNRYKFSYAYKPKGDRMIKSEFPSPDYVKARVENKKIEDVSNEPAFLFEDGYNMAVEYLNGGFDKEKFNKNYEYIIRDGFYIVNKHTDENMIELGKIFDCVPGLSASKAPKMLPYKKNEHYVAFLRPSKRMEGLLIGYIDEEKLSEEWRKKIVPANSIIVSTDGAGSHSYAHVYPERFLGNSNTLMLTPRSEYSDMSLYEKIWYSMAITKNRYKFSYAYKPKGNRMKDIKFPHPITE